MNTARVNEQLSLLSIEVPSWAFGNSGTRFKVFPQEGVPRDAFEKVADAAMVNRLTGAAGKVALHIPWDTVDDYSKLAAFANDEGIAIGTINSNTFQDNDYMLGSVTHPDTRVRRKAIDHLLECIDVMDQTGSRDLKLWFSDGTNYPGQDDIDAMVHDCLKVSAVAAVIAGITTGGAAALKAAEAALLACLREKVSSGAIDVSIRVTTTRGPWE